MKDTHGTKHQGWIGVDLDGTLAQYNGWKGIEHIGAPVPLMLARVKKWLADGVEVRIVTARATPGRPDYTESLRYITEWLIENVGHGLPITNEKGMAMMELWDDRAVQVEPNTGRRMDCQPEEGL